jgi:hypothetical protein
LIKALPAYSCSLLASFDKAFDRIPEYVLYESRHCVVFVVFVVDVIVAPLLLSLSIALFSRPNLIKRVNGDSGSIKHYLQGLIDVGFEMVQMTGR